MLPLRLLLLLLLPLSACMRANLLSNTPVVQPPSEARQAFDAATAALRQNYLDRDTVPGPVVSHTPQTQSDGHFSVTVTPVRAEAQPWNVWPDGTARLFNDAVGYLWLVQLRSVRDVRWSPAHTRLAVNDTEQTFFPVAQADDLLGHLLQGAKWETRVGAPSNLDLRMRNADDFRRAYLGTDPRKGDREGVLLFPAPTRNLQAVAMELTLGVWSEGDGVREYRFLFE
ncbi:MAG: hypothetical protein Q8P41_29790 [Pseudomonadota bacterium]|nr:hypothetical protein [Pseudomonadota bacterium]